MKRRQSSSVRLAKAQQEHDKFLKKHGIDPTKKPKLRGHVPSNLVATTGKRPQSDVATSDVIPASGSAKPRSPDTNLPIAQVYHKGPLMVVTNMDTLTGSKRR